MKVSIINNILKIEIIDENKKDLFKPGSVSRIYLDSDKLKIATSDNEEIVYNKSENDEPEYFEDSCNDVINWFQNNG